jgi:RNA polymerase sigma factor, sigma-70 family
MNAQMMLYNSFIMQNVDDRLLVSKLKNGDKIAFEQLFYKYSGKLYNSIALLLYNKSNAKDITQSTFLIIWEKRESLDPDKNFPAYLYTIARNLVYKETERLILNNKFVESKLVESEMYDENIVEDLNNSYIQNRINDLVSELPPTPQEIFRLKNENELSVSEIAAKMELTERSVEAHLYRTMKFLKEKLRNFVVLLVLLYLKG